MQADVEAMYDSFVSAMANAGSLSNALVMRLTHRERLDVITGLVPPRLLVPEPGTLALIGFAIAAAGLARRRR